MDDSSAACNFSDQIQKRARERGVVWKVNNGLKALKVGGTCLVPARLAVQSCEPTISKSTFSKFSNAFQTELKNAKRPAGTEVFFMIGEHESTNRTFGKETVTFSLFENGPFYKVVFCSKDLFQSCKVWPVESLDRIVVVNDQSPLYFSTQRIDLERGEIISEIISNGESIMEVEIAAQQEETTTSTSGNELDGEQNDNLQDPKVSAHELNAVEDALIGTGDFIDQNAVPVLENLEQMLFEIENSQEMETMVPQPAAAPPQAEQTVVLGQS